MTDASSSSPTRKKKKPLRARRTPKVTRADSPTAAAVRESRERLRAAIDRACIARGEAQWTNGYRCAAFQSRIGPGAEEERLYQKELAQFRFCQLAEARVDGLVRAYARAVKASR